MNSINYLLVRDSQSAKRLRRYLANKGPIVGTRVGTWLDLIGQVKDAYLADQSGDWPEALHGVLGNSESAFWRSSYQVDTNGVADAIARGWRTVLCSATPGSAWPTSDNPRIAKRLADLNCLNDVPVNDWPHDLAVIKQVFDQDIKPLRGIAVIPVALDGRMDAWQRTLIERLNADAVDGPQKFLTEVVAEYEAELVKSQAKVASRLRTTQDNLFSGAGEWSSHDSSCEFIRVRDTLESFELVAGLIHQSMSDAGDRSFADFGLLLPRDFKQALQLHNAFEAWGIPLANLRMSRNERDLGAELLRFALLRFEGPVPSMALKALVTNPLMPWPRNVGIMMANGLNDFGFGVAAPKDLPPVQKSLVDLLNAPAELESVPEKLQQIVGALSQDESLVTHRERALSLTKLLTDAIKAGVQDWDALRSICNPIRLALEDDSLVTQEGVTIYYEGETPWRSVKELFILDFVDGHYPQHQGLSLVFSPDEWRQLVDDGLKINLPRALINQERLSLLNQLKQTSERVRFIVPGYTAAGDAQSPSATLTDIALLAGQISEPEKLLLEFESEHDREQITGLPLAEPEPAVQPRGPAAVDVQLDVNLLAASETSVDRPKPQSPSGLDTLLLSPLAWLLRQHSAEPVSWDPDEFTPLINGTLAHDVFEELFGRDTHKPSWESIEPKIQTAFSEALKKQSPFLGATGWAVERQNLLGTITRAAKQWCVLLNELDATVLQPEIWLHGYIDGIAIHGQADALLSLPEQGVVVVDYKNSKSDKFSNRMNARLDLQASLYRQMIKTGGAKPDRNKQDEEIAAEIQDVLKTRPSAGVVYFTMSDRQATSDFPTLVDIGGWEFVAVNVSEEGIALLKQRFGELRKGWVRAVQDEEVKALTGKGIGDFALRVSPLTAATVAAKAEGAGYEA